MSPRSLHAQEDRRTAARIILILLVMALATFLLFSTGPGGGISFAQPTTPGTVEVAFLNPSEDTSNEVSTKEDEDTAYHLVAWVGDVPTDPTVKFEYQKGAENPQPIDSDAVQVGDDTFETFWDDSDVPDEDGDYQVRVRVFSGDTQVGANAHDIVINDQNDPDPPMEPLPPGEEEQGETVEITSPANGDPMGFYESGGNDTGVVRVTTSTDTESVDVYYAISGPGDPPQWTLCADGESAADAEDGIGCTLEDEDDPQDVNAVAAVAKNESAFIDPEAPQADYTPDSGDAHRTNGYEQFVTSLEMDIGGGETVGNRTPGECSAIATAIVLDQEDAPIARANVDVHARGPSDSLQFGSDAPTAEQEANEGTSEFQAPDSGHEAPEDARDCDANAAGGEQGDHETADNGIKHIESVDGTGDDGSFRFKLYQPVPGTPGTTQFTAWADVDEDDVYCSQEPHDDSAIGWDQPSGAATGVSAEEETCTVPQPTGTTSPSPSTSTSPAPSTSTSTSPSPTETTPPPPVSFDTGVSIKYKNGAFKGGVDSDNGRCERARKMLVKKKKPGKDPTAASDRTNRRGKYSKKKKNAEGKYYAVATKKTFTDDTGREVTCKKGKSRTIDVG